MNLCRYLGSPISTDLEEDKEIKIQIGKAWVFHSRDIDRRVKYNIYISSPLNMLLWGSKTWNLTKTNMKKLSSFHHCAIRYIFGIRWKK